MPAENIVRDPHSLIRARTLLGIATLLGGTISFCGWAFDVPRLTDWFADGVSIQPNPSLLIVLAGIALVLLQSGPRQLVSVLGAVIALVGALTLSQYILGIDHGFNHQLTFGRDWGAATTMSPGRMGPPASTSFTLIGAAFLLLGLRPDAAARAGRYVPMLGIAVCVIGTFSLIGHLFDAKPLYSLPWLTAIARQTALMLIALAVGLVMAVPDREPLRLLLSDSGAGALARRIVPALVLLPPLLGLLRIRGEALGYYDPGTGKALLILGIAMLSVAMLWWALLALARHEASDRESARAVLQEQKLVAETLRDANRRKNEFLAILAHELRGPLAPLRNSLELMKRADRNEPLFGRARIIMDRQLSHLARLVDDLIDVSRITRDRIEIRREPIELRGLLGGCVEACRTLTEERGQHVDFAVPATPVYVEADAVRLTQVLPIS
jgi:signal transduction histidine kinase